MQNNYNLRIVYNVYGANNFNSTKKIRIKGQDLNDKSTYYYNTIKVVNTYEKTNYIKIDKTFIKLKDYIIQLKKAHIKYVISKDAKTITNKATNKTYNIRYTSKAIIEGNKKDYKMAARLYN